MIEINSECILLQSYITDNRNIVNKDLYEYFMGIKNCNLDVLVLNIRSYNQKYID